MKSIFIFYVSDQDKSCDFYRNVLGVEPILDVPGMTEFQLNDGSVLGLMPETGIKKLLGEKLPDPMTGNGIPRSELYLSVDNPEEFHQRSLASGAIELSPLTNREWGEAVAYSLDRDGHVLAFGGELLKQS